ncbi:hypothetical protein SAMN05444392_11321 [Seinonella peptonophila]|uniref:Uncharacterized protein n=1 Tax=Seinonella peptonophila TaxID=112248 RepID=A0A1M5ACF6_9BACL|nr:hypothetical protein [Seinonella peptonophila]SHF27777.1 hypothetical protein SAMN05444392_11321 [Seinonella peptonophila]
MSIAKTKLIRITSATGKNVDMNPKLKAIIQTLDEKKVVEYKFNSSVD